MISDRHSLLARQIRRCFGNDDAVPSGDWRAFLDAVNQAYHQSDIDRALLERSMDLSSQELIQANSEMRALFQAIPDLFFRFAADGTILDCKTGRTQDLLLPVAELVGRKIQNIPVREVGASFAAAIGEVQATGSTVRLEYGLVREGRRQLYEARLLPLRSQQMIAIIRNITELKETEEALRRSECDFRNSLSLLQATLDSTADGILVVDRAGNISVCNRRFAEMWRIPDALLQSGDDDRVIASVLDQLANPEAFLAKVRELYSHPEAESQDVLEFLDGRVFERYSRPQRIGGECVGRVWSFRDVTERRRAEEERARFQVMGALGHLVGSLAHEVRNPLFAISATLEAVMMELEDPRYEPLRRLLDCLREPTARLSELMSELLEYGKPLSQNLAEGSLHDVVRQAVADCGGLAAERKVEIEVRLGETEPRVGMIRHRLLMALDNLIQNAIQHTPSGKVVLVEVGEVEAEDGAWVRFSLKDSGSGFNMQDLPRIFEPFFTRRRGGTGLGLSIVQRIAEEHRARLVAGNRPEGGAVVTLDIPRWPPRSGSA
ncbi:MAG TPA: ATP-binding protein [Thermoanaerobaculia bacterium]|nr:ATP-binding protein [Thermoanaerobaculia bacterium]